MQPCQTLCQDIGLCGDAFLGALSGGGGVQQDIYGEAGDRVLPFPGENSIIIEEERPPD